MDIHNDDRPEYFGLELQQNSMPSKEITAGLRDRPDAVFSFWRADIWGFEGDSRWPTASWVEMAFEDVTGDYRVLWKSGFDDVPQMPAAILSDWLNAINPEMALAQLYESMKIHGRPMIGVEEMRNIGLRDGRWRYLPIVRGYDFSPPSNQS